MILLFDLDGTLIDSTEAILESFHNSFDIHDTPHPEDTQITALIGHPLDVMYQELGVEESRVWDFVATYKAHYRKISRAKTVLLPRAREAVELASSFARLGVVTTKTARYSKELLEHFGIMHSFEVLVGREDITHPKPHPEPIYKALEAFEDVKKERCYMIGDTRMDIAAANAAGIGSIAVVSGYDNFEQLSSLAKIIKKDALEAVEHLKNL